VLILFYICGSIRILFGYLSILLLVECIGYVRSVRRSVLFQTERWVCIFFVGLCRPYIPCNSQDDFHYREHI
jgi:hypothetical protein